MVNPLNGAGSQLSALVNPFEQKPGQQQQVDGEDKQSDKAAKKAQTANAGDVFNVKHNKSAQNQNVAHTGGSDNKKSTTAGRGSLVDITV